MRPDTRARIFFCGMSLIHQMISRAEEALLGRTLLGRTLAHDVRDPDGFVLFRKGAEIDRALLDQARERELLEEVAHAAERGTSDTELEDLLWWLKQHRERHA